MNIEVVEFPCLAKHLPDGFFKASKETLVSLQKKRDLLDDAFIKVQNEYKDRLARFRDAHSVWMEHWGNSIEVKYMIKNVSVSCVLEPNKRNASDIKNTISYQGCSEKLATDVALVVPVVDAISNNIVMNYVAQCDYYDGLKETIENKVREISTKINNQVREKEKTVEYNFSFKDTDVFGAEYEEIAPADDVPF